MNPPGSSELRAQYEISLPRQDGEGVDQDQEWCEVVIDGEKRRIRFHDYHDIYSIPGLYEQIFYELLECDSPRFVCSRLAQVLELEGEDFEALRVLDLGAGNGMVGEQLRDRGARCILGADLIAEAAEAAERDRPGVYDEYVVGDMTALDEERLETLRDAELNCLTTVAALGFGDIPPQVFAAAYEHIETGGFVAFNLNENFVADGDPSGFATSIRRSAESGALEILDERHYRHRLSIAGEPISYRSIVARKRGPLELAV